MAVLNSWQRIDRVLKGRPWGNASDGSLSVSSNTTQTLTARSCSGSSTSTTLTLGSSGFTNGDVVAIHQSRGTGVGQWEINRIASGGGTTSLTMQEPLQYTYTDSGASQAQILKIPMYSTATIDSARTLSGAGWDGDINGFIILAARESITVTGTVDHKGTITHTTSTTGRTGGGFRGGNAAATNAQRGEGTSGAASTGTTANGNGGGGAAASGAAGASGGGGGNGGSGSAGTESGGGTPGAGGGQAGAADLTNVVFGGGGGGAARDSGGSNEKTGGASGGGIIMLISKQITVVGGITARGGDSDRFPFHEGGSGGGGSVLFVCENATLGSGLTVATGGVRVNADTNPSTAAGAGGTGRIAVHYSGSVTGTTNPTYTGQLDESLVEKITSSNFFAFF